MADDIFEKMWEQLGRIYDAVRDGNIPRANDGSRQSPVAAARMMTRDLFGTRDTATLSDTAVMDLRDEVKPSSPPTPKRNEYWEYLDQTQRDRLGDAYHNVEAPPVIEQQTVAAEIREAVREIAPAITGAIGDLQQSGSGDAPASGDPIKGSRSDEHEARVESQLDRIGDALDLLAEMFGSQVEATKEVVKETKDANQGSMSLKKSAEILATTYQLLANLLGDKVNDNPLKSYAGKTTSGKKAGLFK